MKALKDKTNTRWVPSKVAGAVLTFIGILPFLLWLLQVAGFLLPEGRDPVGAWPVVVIAVAAFGLGTMLFVGKGESVGASLLSWFSRRDT